VCVCVCVVCVRKLCMSARIHASMCNYVKKSTLINVNPVSTET